MGMTSETATDRGMRADFDSLRAEDLWRSDRIKWRLYGDQVLPAWVADMDYPVAPPIQRALTELLERSDLGYHHVPLSPRLREALVARMHERFDWQVEPERVVPLVNALQGLDASVLLHSRKGEGVIVQTPIYPPFLAAVGRSGRRLVENVLLAGPERYEIEFDRLRADIDSDTRVFLLCNPHNPTGRVFELDELRAVAELALEHDLIVVSDEIHADLVYPGHKHIPFASLGPEVADRTITLTSATKAFNLAGLPCAFAVFGGDRAQQPFAELPPHLLGHCGILDDAATHAAWTQGQAWLDAVLGYRLENRDTLLDYIRREIPGIRVLRPEATYLAWLDCRGLEVGDPYRFFLEHARVAFNRGTDFGTPGEGFVRLNFATSAAILGRILERMAEAVKKKGIG
jgi:cystathionine beta-lyase